MYHILPKKKYECSKCGSHKARGYQEVPHNELAGHYYGVECLDCGHKTRHYEESIYEKMSGSGGSYSYNPNERIKF